ncbi:hypothetical protein Nepgr_024734 [Nepenthes gracilis]|uniref:Uncharacterized protein n=1 Tax=Nepenthes gracilis TaxID=150966 RepID=A0AAD3Y0T5_NEPGR|nr:hypothetical protein Nepgr_024734 [Nepenthes gracilis]
MQERLIKDTNRVYKSMTVCSRLHAKKGGPASLQRSQPPAECKVVSAEGSQNSTTTTFVVLRQIQWLGSKKKQAASPQNEPTIRPHQTNPNQTPMDTPISISRDDTSPKKSDVPSQQRLWTHLNRYSRAKSEKGCSSRTPKTRTNVSSKTKNGYHPYLRRTYHSSKQAAYEISHITTMLKSAWWTTI